MVVGSEKMVVFNDMAEHRLIYYPHKIEWLDELPTAIKADGEAIDIEDTEPLKAECLHFLDCVSNRTRPRSDGEEGLRVLKVLDACQKALDSKST